MIPGELVSAIRGFSYNKISFYEYAEFAEKILSNCKSYPDKDGVFLKHKVILITLSIGVVLIDCNWEALVFDFDGSELVETSSDLSLKLKTASKASN